MRTIFVHSGQAEGQFFQKVFRPRSVWHVQCLPWKTVQLLCAQSLLTTTDKTLMTWFCWNWIRVPHREQIAKCCWKDKPHGHSFHCMVFSNTKPKSLPALSQRVSQHGHRWDILHHLCTVFTNFYKILQDFTRFYKPSIEPFVCLGHAGGRARGLGPGWVSVESENRVTTIDPSRPLYGFQMD